MSGSSIESILAEKTSEGIKKLYGQTVPADQITLQKTRPEFEGDLTLLVFPLTKASKKSPEETANAIGNYLKENIAEVTAFNVVKGFLNLVIADSYWIKYLSADSSNFAPHTSAAGETVMVEFSSPNTNKPLHLGHIRNNLLGASVAEILKAAGKKVIRVNLVNDRGIHICKSMLAWLGRGNGETPENTTNPKHRKGDHLVGNYYVEFDKLYKKEIELSETLAYQIVTSLKEQKKNSNYSLPIFLSRGKESIQRIFLYIRMAGLGKEKKLSFEVPSIEEFIDQYPNLYVRLNDSQKKIFYDYTNDLEKSMRVLNFEKIDTSEFVSQILKIAQDYTPLVYDAHYMLRQWEAGDKDTVGLWRMMNGWVYDGFAKTYKELGIEFEKTYYESQTYLLGKEIVEEGVRKNVFKRREDGSVWVDLTADGLDEKLLLRSDGTSVYMTQDLGTAIKRQEEFHFNRLVYVVGNEQDYHFKVLFLILKKLGYQWAQNLFHLSYGMVDLPSGKMKSREGTVVDADDLISEMVNTAGETTKALGKTEGMSESEAEALYHAIGLGALKYFILKVDPKKRMLFDPKESIDFNGNTGPFIQYTYARIKSVLRKANQDDQLSAISYQPLAISYILHKKEKEVIKILHGFPAAVQEAANAYNPGHIANYVYELAREYNQFYHEIPILKSENEQGKNFRLLLSAKTAEVIKTSLKLLGITVPERM